MNRKNTFKRSLISFLRFHQRSFTRSTLRIQTIKRQFLKHQRRITMPSKKNLAVGRLGTKKQGTKNWSPRHTTHSISLFSRNSVNSNCLEPAIQKTGKKYQNYYQGHLSQDRPLELKVEMDHSFLASKSIDSEQNHLLGQK